jgi:hypothetical protein
MASSAQIVANQNNALLSTGPKTPEGKSAAARNSIKHGLSGAFTVLPHEDQDEFDILLACLRDEMAPANEHESFLVEQMAQSRWRLRRLQRLENAAFELLMEIEQGSPLVTLDSDHRIAARMIQGRGDALASLHRYSTAAERSYYKAHKEFLAARRAAPPKVVQNEPKRERRQVQNEPNSAPKFPTVQRIVAHPCGGAALQPA